VQSRDKEEPFADLEEETSFAENGSASVISNGHSTSDSGDLAAAAREALTLCKSLHTSTSTSSSWKKAIDHADVVVYSSKSATSNDDAVPSMYKASVTLSDTTPEKAFALLSQPEIWDQWLASTNVVSDVSHNISHLYVVWDAVPSSSPRDLSLVEINETDEQGNIYLCATSVKSDALPIVEGRRRATVPLSAFVLIAQGNDTILTHYFSTKGKALYTKLFPHRHIAKHIATSVSNIKRGHRAVPSPASSKIGKDRSVFSGSRLSVANGSDDSPSKRKRMASLFGSSRNIHSLSGSIKHRSASGPPSTLGASKTSLVNGTAAEDAGSIIDREEPSDNRANGIPAEQTEDIKPAGDAAGATSKVSIPVEAPLTPEQTKLHESFTALLKDSQSWQCTKDKEGEKIWTNWKEKGTLPIVRVQVEITAKGLTSEEVLSVIRDSQVRRMWNKQISSTKLVKSKDGSAVYTLDCRRGMLTHLKPTHQYLDSSIQRSDPSSDKSTITFISSSIDDSLDEEPSKSTRTALPLSGYRIEPKGGKILIHHLQHVEAAEKDLPDFVGKTVAVGVMRDLRLLKNYLENSQIPPSWLRWSSGPIHVINEHFNIDSKSYTYELEHLESSTEEDQHCLLQYSAKTFPNGISISLESASAAKVTKSSAFRRTLDFRWSKEKSDQPVKLKIESGKDKDQILLNGEAVEYAALPNGETRAEEQEEEVDDHHEAEDVREQEDQQPMGDQVSSGLLMAAGRARQTTADADEQSSAIKYDTKDSEQSQTRSSKDTFDLLPYVGSRSILIEIQTLSPGQLTLGFLLCLVSFLLGRYT